MEEGGGGEWALGACAPTKFNVTTSSWHMASLVGWYKYSLQLLTGTLVPYLNGGSRPPICWARQLETLPFPYVWATIELCDEGRSYGVCVCGKGEGEGEEGGKLGGIVEEETKEQVCYTRGLRSTCNMIWIGMHILSLAKLLTAQDTVWPIPGPINHHRVAGRWELLSSSRKAFGWLVLSSLGTRPSKNRKEGSGKQGGMKVYTAEC